MKNNIKFIVLYYRCFQGKQIKNKNVVHFSESMIIIYII